jgi:hypothetical protein
VVFLRANGHVIRFSSRILAQVIDRVEVRLGEGACEATGRTASKLNNFLLPQVFEVRQFQKLVGSETVLFFVDQHLQDDVLGLLADVGDKLRDALEFLGGEFEFHMGRVFLELVKQVLRRRSNDVMDLVNLVELVVTREEGEQ